ncbi:RagB/SusD family nutrient uptake outer membrane protein [Dawidia soli]|uniref:RagB/SusD family nutrient uptake outer membrane protein n=1 Tax=Dawidia soli TaxID=2782352 RepID=A0AAP2GHW3_9BACT|nr:RagB/SusD family nutrient uptake outer membrane protein [Dawidia soli]MBT1687606.1 RagB/SusD family nutrient uptake outer membrane protein [Dawidia soli]
MKKISYYILLSIASLAAVSCDDFLDKEPIDQISSDQYFTDEKSVTSAVIALYNSLVNANYYGRAMLIVPELAAGQVVSLQQYPEYMVFTSNTINIDNPWTLNIWASSYTTINAANNVLALESAERAAEVTFSNESTRNALLREAKFIRALVYFNLVRSFGDVPLITTPTTSGSTNLQVARASVSEVYAQIISDLGGYEELPGRYAAAADMGRATRWAAEALLAKVYLYSGNYERASALAGDVIMNGGYLPTDNYGDVWTKENSTESIFEIQYDAQVQNELAKNVAQTGGIFGTSKAIYDQYDSADERRYFNVVRVETEKGDQFFIGKYPSGPAVQNIPVIRLAEVYLIYAEAEARRAESVTEDAYNYYKAVRDRAGVETPEISTFTTLQDFITVVQREKRLEMMFEGEAWFDYTRTELALTEMMQNPDPGRFVFPIPQAERDLNPNLSQNDAYLNR